VFNVIACVRSKVVGIATRRAARDETGARPDARAPVNVNTHSETDDRQQSRLVLCFVVSVVEALNNRVYYEGMSNKRRTCVFSFNAIPDKRQRNHWIE
jgi:hypothetical protein